MNITRFIKYIFILFFIIYLLPSSAIEQAEEGWRWKKTFVLQVDDQKQYNVDYLHNTLKKHVDSIATRFSAMSNEDEANRIIQKFRQYLAFVQEHRDGERICMLFEELRNNDTNIAALLKGEESEQLRAYWLENKDLDASMEEANDKIKDIIRHNLKSLSQKNIVIASIGTIKNGKFETKVITVPGSQYAPAKIAVFLSGLGGNFLELLELIEFPHYTFIIFDRPYEQDTLYLSLLNTSLENIFAHPLDDTLKSLKEKSKLYMEEVNTCTSNANQLKKKIEEYNSKIDSMKNNLSKMDGDPYKIIDERLNALQTTQIQWASAAVQLVKDLYDIREAHSEFKWAEKFFHSEQLLRIYLYNNLGTLVRKSFGLKETNHFLSIHIHSLHDVCEICTHSLFLESEMCNVDTLTERPKPNAHQHNSNQDACIKPYGFFEKFSNEHKAVSNRYKTWYDKYKAVCNKHKTCYDEYKAIYNSGKVVSNRRKALYHKHKMLYNTCERMANHSKALYDTHKALSNLKYQILVTSGSALKNNGSSRWESGHDGAFDLPIDLRFFPPLLAFRIIPDDVL